MTSVKDVSGDRTGELCRAVGKTWSLTVREMGSHWTWEQGVT